jgi:hypothetical protein
MPSRIYLSDIVNYNWIPKKDINLEMTRSILSSKLYSKEDDKAQLQRLKELGCVGCIKIRSKK